MDYFQGIVTEFLRADRAVFVNTECCIQLNPGLNPDTSGPHWYCDAVAVNQRESAIYLCEITYSKSLASLQARLAGWAAHWTGVKAALVRDSALPPMWPVRPWIFIPASLAPSFEKKIQCIPNIGNGPDKMPTPRITALEEVLPWKYCSWNRTTDSELVSSNEFPVPVHKS